MNKSLALAFIALGALGFRAASAQSWTLLQNVPSMSATNPLLLTDGSVMIQDGDTSNWWKLTPDKKGNYATGSWKQLASLHSTWGPLYIGSEVMPDGRVFVIGGEYNLSDQPSWWSDSGVYDPVKNTWSYPTMPTAWQGALNMGDTATITLPNGLVFIAHPEGSDCGAYNPITNSYIYPYGGKSHDFNDEAGMTTLPNGNIFRVDCFTDQQAEVFNTQTLQWTLLPKLPYSVLDVPDAEIGAAILQYNGQIIQFGGNGQNVIWDTNSSAWASAPAFPKDPTFGQIDVADGGATILPDGTVVVDAGAGYGAGPAAFFTFNGSSLSPLTGAPGTALMPGFTGNFVLLPSGQALFTDQDTNICLLTPSGSAKAAWAPTISFCPPQLRLGSSYQISGTQFNGLTNGSAYGDDAQANTNYPIIRIRNNSSGDVFYEREFNPSTMAICTGSATETTHFIVSVNTETGPSTVQVVTNGIASTPYPVTVLPPPPPTAISVYPQQGIYLSGNVATVSATDNVFYTVHSVALGTQEQLAAVETDFNIGSSIGVSQLYAFINSKAKAGATEQVFFFNYAKNQWILGGNSPISGTATSYTFSPTGTATQYISSTGVVKMVIRAIVPSHISPLPFTFYIDSVGMATG